MTKRDLSSTIDNLKSPLNESSDPPADGGKARVDSKLLIQAWTANVEVQREVLGVMRDIEKWYKANEKDNEATRAAVADLNRSNKVMKKFMTASVCAVMLSSVVVARYVSVVGINVAAVATTVQIQAQHTHDTADEAKRMLKDALYAMSTQQEAQAARDEAIVAPENSAARAKAEEKKVVAEVAIIQAQKKAAPTPLAKARTEKRLKKARRRAKALKVTVDDGILEPSKYKAHASAPVEEASSF